MRDAHRVATLLVVAVALNVAARRSSAQDPLLWRLTAAANVLTSVFVLVYVAADPAPQNYPVVALILALTGSFFLNRTVKSRPGR